MRKMWLSILPGVLAATSLSAASAAPDRAAFDRSIAATKAAMMTDPRLALSRADRALALAPGLADPAARTLALATAHWLQAEALIYLNEPARARSIVDAALSSVERIAPDSKLRGDLLRSRGAIAATGGQAQAALADFQRAYEVFVRAGEARSQAIALQDIGEIYLDAGDHARVLQYYAQSADVFSADPFLLLTTHNNRAQVLREMRRFPEAVAEYRAALRDARTVKSPLLEVRILTNLAAAQVDAGQLEPAARSVASAIALSRTGEAHGWQPFVWGVSAKLSAARGDAAGAARLLERMFAGTNLAKSTMPYREFHGLAARVYERLGRQAAALAHLKAFQRLDGEARTLSASTNAQLMAARFDFANQNLKISTLKQGQLSRDIQIERQRTRFRTVVLSGLLGAGGVVFALLLFGYLSTRRSRNQVRAANDRLTDSNARLEKALAAKTEFLAMTSHEIRTPLNGILGMTQVLLADHAITGKVRGRVEVVHGAGEAMRALVDDILDVAKMETGQIRLTSEEVDLPRLLDEAVRLWGAQARIKGLTLTLLADDAPARIVGDAARLRQIVFNLMSNAIKFTDRGDVTLEVAAENDALLAIRVRDSGIGIPAEQHALIFESFQQADRGMTRQFGGTGLGLAICRNLVTAMGGRIAVSSAPGAGSTFEVMLPLVVPVTSAAPAGIRAAPDRLSAARLMIVEPNPLKQSIMRATLTGVAAALETAATVADAMDAIAAQRIDHVVVDVDAFGGEGLSPLRDLTHAAVRVTALHRATEEFPATLLIPLGFDQVIAKPVSGHALITALAMVYRADSPGRAAPQPQPQPQPQPAPRILTAAVHR